MPATFTRNGKGIRSRTGRTGEMEIVSKRLSTVDARIGRECVHISSPDEKDGTKSP